MLIGLLAEKDYLDKNLMILQQYDVQGLIINNAKSLENIDGLIITGCNYKILKKIIDEKDIKNKLKICAINGIPILGINAGINLIAKNINNNSKLKIMDIYINNNKKDNIIGTKEIYIPALDITPFKVSFKNSPYIWKVAPNVGILSKIDDKIILARQGNYLVCSFQAEEMQRHIVHKYFFKMIKDALKNKKNT